MLAHALFASLLLMVITRHEVRVLRLHGTFDPAAWKVAPQWPAFLVFLFFFVLAATLVAYMFRLFFRGNARAGAAGSTTRVESRQEGRP